ncbi:ABC transporter ATP-binding protein [Paenibacillaceae bacterium]|nr:ABC transporter ATP-binding protein [Paenibacillaceae bacterium]
METILASTNVYKTYQAGKPNEQHVLKNINLQIKKGEFVAIMGPSGSGKSTLLYSISGMDKMTAGSVTFSGKELSGLNEKELAHLRLTRMGFIFQHMHLLKNLSIFDNIILSAYMAKQRSRTSINARAAELMEKAGISGLASHDVSQASGGQLQRVAICRALINQPDILFGDEPTGALNSRTAGEIMDILAEINRAGTTILLVTHDVKVAAKTDRILFMIDGSISAEQQLGKYRNGDDSKERETRLTNWLMKMGF